MIRQLFFLAVMMIAVITQGQIKYTGAIGKYPIELTIGYPIKQATDVAYMHTHTPVFASYYYTKHKKPITLKGIWDIDKNLLLVEENPDGTFLFEFKNFSPQQKELKGTWKGNKQYPISLIQISNTENTKHDSISYTGYINQHPFFLKIEEPFEKTEMETGIDIHKKINKVKATLEYQGQYYLLTGTWGDRGFMMKGTDSKNNIFYLNINHYNKEINQVETYWIHATKTETITLFKDLKRTITTIQNKTTPKHYFKLVQYHKDKESNCAIEIYNKSTNAMIQRIDNFYCDSSIIKDPEAFSLGDFNFDGILDIRFISDFHMKGASIFLLLATPSDKKHPYFLTKSISENVVFDKENHWIIESSYYHGTRTDQYYKWNDMFLEPIKKKTFQYDNGQWIEK